MNKPILQNIINSMTNWQRGQAGKACKGIWKDLNIEQLKFYASMPHWKASQGGK